MSRPPKKAARRAAQHTAVNRSRASRMRTFLRKVEEAIARGDKAAAQAAFREAEPVLMRGAQKEQIHRNTAARKLSRLAHRINAL